MTRLAPKGHEGRVSQEQSNSSPGLARKPTSSPDQPLGTGGGSFGATAAPIARHRESAALG
jgi:hypothetical protein